MRILIIALTLFISSCNLSNPSETPPALEYRKMTEGETKIAKEWIGFFRQSKTLTSDPVEKKTIDSLVYVFTKYVNTGLVDLETGIILAETELDIKKIQNGIYD